jgi:vitamin B12 transporter
MDKWNIAPRMSRWHISLRTIARHHLHMASFIKTLKENIWRHHLYNLGFAKATHYILQYQKIIPKGYTFRSEIFYKKYNNLFKTAPNSNGREVASI